MNNNYLIQVTVTNLDRGPNSEHDPLSFKLDWESDLEGTLDYVRARIHDQIDDDEYTTTPEEAMADHLDNVAKEYLYESQG